MEFVVLEETLAVTVVILHEEKLVVALEDAVTEFDDGVVVGLPTLALDEGHRDIESLGGCHRQSELVDTAVGEYVLVVHTVDDRYPEFRVDREARIKYYVASERDLVP